MENNSEKSLPLCRLNGGKSTRVGTLKVILHLAATITEMCLKLLAYNSK